MPIACYVLDQVIENTEVESKLSELARTFGDSVVRIAKNAKVAAQDVAVDLYSFTEKAVDSVKQDVIPDIQNVFRSFGSTIKNKTLSVIQTLRAAY